MPQYKITWVIDEEAFNPIEAAQKAWEHRTDADSTANVFYVQQVYIDGPGPALKIDLSDFDNPEDITGPSEHLPDASYSAHDAWQLLQDCLEVFNQLPNKSLKEINRYRDTHHLARVLSQYLKSE